MKATWAGGKPTPAFNNAAQVWNHTFYWESISPKKSSPSGALAAAIDRDFGSLDDFSKEFSAAGATQFGSGWAWLVVDEAGKLSIRKTPNAETPLTDESVTAILTMDGKMIFFPLYFSFFNHFFLRKKNKSHLSRPSSSFSLPLLFATKKNSLGARLLPRLREQEARVHRRVRQRAYQLGQGRGEVCRCRREVRRGEDCFLPFSPAFSLSLSLFLSFFFSLFLPLRGQLTCSFRWFYVDDEASGALVAPIEGKRERERERASEKLGDEES